MSHLVQSALLGVSCGFGQQETHGSAKTASNDGVGVLDQANQSAENSPGVAVRTEQIHMLAEVRHGFQKCCVKQVGGFSNLNVHHLLCLSITVTAHLKSERKLLKYLV